jgi:hypothetical protein
MAVPGEVTSNLVGSTYQAMSPTAEAYMYREMDRKREEREQRNREIMAQRAAEQQAAQQATNQDRVHAAFNQMYAPQLQRAYQDTAVSSAPTNTAAGKARDYAIQHGFQYGGIAGQPNTDIINSAVTSKLPQPEMSQTQLQNTLGHMWSAQTDPYKRTAGQMGGMMTLFHPSDSAAREWGATKGWGSATKKKSKGKEEDELGEAKTYG